MVSESLRGEYRNSERRVQGFKEKVATGNDTLTSGVMTSETMVSPLSNNAK